MALGERLQTLAGMLGSATRMADIGSDHAKLPIWLVQNTTVEYAVAGEVRPGPFQAAQKNILRHGLANRVQVRLGDGLSVIEPGEVEAVVLAGMGGASIRGILQRSPAVFRQLSKIILQPMNGFLLLRSFLQGERWRLVEEKLVREEGRIYVALAAVPGVMECDDELLLEVGPLLWQQKPPLLKEYLQDLIAQYRRKICLMERSTLSEVGLRRTLWLEKTYRLEEMLKCL